MRRIAFIATWSILGTIIVYLAFVVFVHLLGVVGIAGTDPSGRLAFGSVPAFVYVCGLVPLVFFVFLIMGLNGKLPGTKYNDIVKTLSPSQYWKCPKCSYDMTSVKGDICPECGESFSLKRK